VYASIARPPLTWYWQLQGSVNNSHAVDAYDIDGFENSEAEVAALHEKGIHVICYVDVGPYEPFRPDAASFPLSIEGNPVEGFTEERWLDVRELATLEPIMTKRFQMCREKGFDAVEPDNMDAWENDTGFEITPIDESSDRGQLASTSAAKRLAKVCASPGQRADT